MSSRPIPEQIPYATVIPTKPRDFSAGISLGVFCGVFLAALYFVSDGQLSIFVDSLSLLGPFGATAGLLLAAFGG